MLKWLAMFAFAVILTVSAMELMAAQQKAPSSNQQGQGNQFPTSTNETNNCVSAQQKEGSADSVEGWHKFVTWPGSWETWALIVTFGVIAWQAILMRTHGKHLHSLAKATFEQAEISRKALVAQFRPKIVVRTIQFDLPSVEEVDEQTNLTWKIEISIVNAGETIAHVTYCTAISFWMDNLKRSRAQIAKEEWKPYSLNPGETKRLILPVEQSTFRTNLNIVERTVGRGNEPQEFPVCKGNIFYSDENGHTRETGFERRWDIKHRRFIASDDPEAEYSD
jgi:hypothetical protein